MNDEARTYDIARGVIIGTVQYDPKTEFTANGLAVFSLVVVVSIPKRGGGVEESDFPVTIFGERAEAISASNTIRKGTRVVTTGRWRKKKWEREGQKRSRTEFLASAIAVLVNPLTTAPATTKGEEEQDDIPF